MKYLLLILVSFQLLTTKAQAQEKFITAIDFELNKEIDYKANLNEGKVLDDLSWAWSSQNACFPKTQKHKFTGKHVLFTGIIPPYSETTITVTPKDKKANFSVYAYQINLNEDFVVPNLPHCITCEADHKWDYRKKGRKKQKHIRTIDNLTAINNSYRLVIGVVGADRLEEGEFIITVKTEEKFK